MSALDAKIDDLYRLPLSEFTGARNVLAKSLKGDEAARVKALAKPAIVPWAVNQVYWRARATFDRLMKSGEKLRAAQIAALEGRTADVRSAGDAHRRAIADAVAEAERLSGSAGAKPNTDALARTFESLSLATTTSESPGRLTEPLQPAGFEAITGIKHLNFRNQTSDFRTTNAERRTTNVDRPSKAALRAAEEAARVAAERTKHDAAVKQADAEVARAEMKERSSRETWERAHDELLSARRALSELRSAAKSAL